MKFVATSDLWDGKKHVAKGEVVEYDDLKIIGELRSARRLSEPGSAEALKVEAEDAEDRKREKRNKKEQLDA